MSLSKPDAPIQEAWTIRTASSDDATVIAKAATRLFVETFAQANTASDMALYVATAFGDEAQRREIADPMCTYLVAYDDRDLVAFALLKSGSEAPLVHGPAPIEVQRFYVDHRYHGRGLAQQLMRACKASAEAKGGRTLWLGVWEHNPRAIKFYEKCGFGVVGTQRFLLGTDLQTDRVMVCAIDGGALPSG